MQQWTRGFLLDGLALFIPIKPHPGAQRKIAEDRRDRRPHAGFDIAVGLVAGADAVKEISPVERMRIGDALHLEQREVRALLRSDADNTAIDIQRTARAMKIDA